MTSVGMIHMACYCGAELFYVGNTPDGKPPYDVIEQFKAQLGPGEFGFFSSANGHLGECPHCGLLFELPDSAIMDWLPFMDQDGFASVIKEMRSAAASKNGSYRNGTSPHQDAV